MSQTEPKKPQIKEKTGIIAEIVECCPLCRVEFEEPVSTNAVFTCPECNSEVLVRKY